VVVAAGNEASDARDYSPAGSPTALTVGATTQSHVRASYSNYGPALDIMAPGSLITSAGIYSDTSYAMMSGTSMACPHVSGAAALVLQISPEFNPTEVLARLLELSKQNTIFDEMDEDPNFFLWVGPEVSAKGGEPTTAGRPGEVPFAYTVVGGVALVFVVGFVMPVARRVRQRRNARGQLELSSPAVVEEEVAAEA